MTSTIVTKFNPTCASCMLNFPDDLSLKDHFRSDFHSFNSKRKMLDLGCVTYEKFVELMKLDAASESSYKVEKLCNLCKKKFTCHATYKQHLRSKKHKDKQKEKSENSSSNKKNNSDEFSFCSSSSFDFDFSHKNTQKEDSFIKLSPHDSKTQNNKDSESLGLSQSAFINLCLICPYRSLSFDQNLSHMAKKHSFFIPLVKYCINQEGLIEFLHKKLFDKKECFGCEGIFDQIESLQQHMIDKNHYLFTIENNQEYDQFYNFTELNTFLKQKCQQLKIIQEEHDAENDEDEWENIEEASHVTTEEELRYYGYRLSHKPYKVTNLGELQLPSRKIVGNRIYKDYYKMKIPYSSAKTILQLSSHTDESLSKNESSSFYCLDLSASNETRLIKDHSSVKKHKKNKNKVAYSHGNIQEPVAYKHSNKNFRQDDGQIKQ